MARFGALRGRRRRPRWVGQRRRAPLLRAARVRGRGLGLDATSALTVAPAPQWRPCPTAPRAPSPTWSSMPCAGSASTRCSACPASRTTTSSTAGRREGHPPRRHPPRAGCGLHGGRRGAGRPGGRRAFAVVPGPGLLNAGAALTSGYWSNARVLADRRPDPDHRARAGAGACCTSCPTRPRSCRQVTKRAELAGRPGAPRPGRSRRRWTRSCQGRPRPVSIEVPADRWSSAAEPTLVDPVPGARPSTATPSSGLPRSSLAPSGR